MLEKIRAMWESVKSWFATTWIWNTIKNLFSSNDASKASGAPLKDYVYDPKAMEEALAKRKAKDDDKETPKQPESNGPEGNEHEEEVSTPNPGRLDDKSKLTQDAAEGKDGNEKPGETSIEPVGSGAKVGQETKSAETPQQGSPGYIKVTDNGLQLIVRKDYVSLIKKTTRNGDYEIYAKIGGKTYGIIGKFPSAAVVSGEYTPSLSTQ